MRYSRNVERLWIHCDPGCQGCEVPNGKEQARLVRVDLGTKLFLDVRQLEHPTEFLGEWWIGHDVVPLTRLERWR